jgi:pimeloyl-ACP methyl ester carboxylesterase
MTTTPPAFPVSDDRCEVSTPLGPVWLWGRPTGRPTLLVITGLFADADTMDHIGGLLPEVDVLRAHLPGNHCPRLSAVSVGVFASALSSALQQVVTAPLGILGLSVGALVAMGVRTPNLKGLILIEPPVFTENLWPLAHPELIARDPELMAAVFGVGDGGVTEPRDYSALVRGLSVPTVVLLGDRPLMPQRPVESMPSLVDEASRDILARQPNVSLSIAPGAGHHVAKQAPSLLAHHVRRLVRALQAGETAPPASP